MAGSVPQLAVEDAPPPPPSFTGPGFCEVTSFQLHCKTFWLGLDVAEPKGFSPPLTVVKIRGTPTGGSSSAPVCGSGAGAGAGADVPRPNFRVALSRFRARWLRPPPGQIYRWMSPSRAGREGQVHRPVCRVLQRLSHAEFGFASEFRQGEQDFKTVRHHKAGSNGAQQIDAVVRLQGSLDHANGHLLLQ